MEPTTFADLSDIKKLQGGTSSFTYEGEPCIANIEYISYIPVGPGGIKAIVTEVRKVTTQELVNARMEIVVSCFFAEIDNTKQRELVVNQLVESEGPLGPTISFRLRD